MDHDNGETFDENRPDGYTFSEMDEVLADYLAVNGDAIAYFGYAYFSANNDTLSAAAIENDDGIMVAPDPTTVADGSYNPLARRIFMNLLTGPSLDMTAPLIKFGFSDEGSELVAQTGYVVIPDEEKVEMVDRVADGLP